MENTIRFKMDRVLSALILAAGIALAGYFMGDAFLRARLQDRYVAVKGLSEREVTSDLAIWPISIKATGNNLTEVNNKIELDRATVIDFLIAQGFKAEEVEIGNYLVNDLLAQTYRQNSSEDFRYIINATIILKTSNVELVSKVSRLQNLLVQKGVVLGNESYEGVSYEFTKFNEIKPEMLAEAIKNARKSANKFVEDSGNKLGYLKRANQGTFLITALDGGDGPDEYSNAQAAKKSIRKRIRLVTTLEYFLKD
jgi:hypothetical protein